MKLKSFKTVILAAVVASAALLYQAGTTLKLLSEAYVFSFPLLIMDKTQDAMLTTGLNNNQLMHLQIFPDHTFRNVVRPNNDTLYSIAWLDLSEQAQVLSVPETNGRYFVMPFMDAWTNVFASVGKRETGTQPGQYLITGPQWDGEIPQGLTQIKAPTTMVWLLGRVQANGPDDLPAVIAFQNEFTLQSLGQWKVGEDNPALVINQPIEQGQHNPYLDIQSLSLTDYFTQISALMIKNPLLPADSAMIGKLAKLGIHPGQPFNEAEFGFWDKAMGKLAVDLTYKTLEKELNNPSALEHGWMIKREGIGRFNDYNIRFGVSNIGLGALPPEEAVYPNTNLDDSGQALTGDHRYRLHFANGEVPPADAFWSLTMYDSDGFLVDNPIRRYSIGDRDDLQFNDDGSLDIVIQHEAPTTSSVNWLPAPKEAFALTLRVYLPTEKLLNGEWTLPGVQQLGSQ